MHARRSDAEQAAGGNRIPHPPSLEGKGEHDAGAGNEDAPTSPLSTPLPAAHLPRPTYWPVVLAFGIALLAWGIVTTLAITLIGLALLALGLGGWIGELRHG